MRSVWLSSTYYLDEAVQKLSANAERMLTRALAHCGSAESQGYVSEAAIKMLGLPNPRKLAGELVAARIFVPREGGGWDFRSWESWNSAGDALIARRKTDRERQARHRAAKQGNSRDESRDSGKGPDAENRSYSSVEREKTGEKSARSGNLQSTAPWPETHHEQREPESLSRNMSRDVTPPEESREEKNSGYVHESATDSNGRGSVAATPGAELVNELIPRSHPDAVRTMLRIRATELLRSHPRADVAAALELWLTKPSLGPNALPSLVSEVIKSRAAPVGAGRQPSKLRAFAELAAEERALEQAQAQSARKELP